MPVSFISHAVALAFSTILAVGVVLPAHAAPAPAPATGFYFGRIAFEDDVIGISVDKAQRVKVLVTDAEPGGDAEWFEGRVRGLGIDLRSASRKARLQATFDPVLKTCKGTIQMRSGTTRAMATQFAEEGADIYDVTVRSGHYTGRSIQGHRVDARQNGVFVTGTLSERGGTQRPFKVMDLSQAFAYSIRGGKSDRYTMIISRNATLHYGRGGAVKRGKPNANLIALDITTTNDPTPGFFFGRVGFERDVVGVKVDAPDMQGVRRLRAYMSDSEPEPGGDLEWFTGLTTGDAVDLTSVTNDARLQATVTDGLISGTVTLPGGRARRFFALPAGDGAGIYDVTVNADGSMTGTSEEGAGLLDSRRGRS